MLNKDINKFWNSDPVVICFATLILSWVLFYNGYPLVYSDSGTYIKSAFDLLIPIDRPKIYGEFIRLSGLGVTLWGAALIQNFILAWLLLDSYRIVSSKPDITKYYLIVLCLSLCTGVSWYSAQIMPDTFAPVLFLGVANLMLRREANLKKDLLLGFILLLSISVHNSHVAISSFLLFSLGLSYLLKKRLNIEATIIGFKEKSVKLFFILVLGISIPVLTHFMYEGKAVYAKSSHVILLSKFAESGVLQAYLEENCDDDAFRKQYPICACKNKAVGKITTFLYDPESPVNREYAWEDHAKEEYNGLLKGMLTSPKYLTLTITSTIQNIITQLFSVEIGSGLEIYEEGTPPHYVIHKYYPVEGYNYDSSRQNKEELYLDVINVIHFLLMISCVVALIAYKRIKSWMTAPQRMMFFYAIAIMVVNSICTGGLHVAYNRFQTRIVWVLPFILLIVLTDKCLRLEKVEKAG